VSLLHDSNAFVAFLVRIQDFDDLHFLCVSVCVRFSNLAHYMKLSKSGALFLSLSHTHNARRATTTSLHILSFSCVCLRVYVSARYPIARVKFFMVKFVRRAREKNSREVPFWLEKRRKNHRREGRRSHFGRFLSRRSDIRITTCRIISLKTPLSLLLSLSLFLRLSHSVNLIC